MKKYEVLASQVVYLSTIVEADNEEQAWQKAVTEANWKDYQAERVMHSETIEIVEEA